MTETTALPPLDDAAFRKIMTDVGMPNSMSLYQALKHVENWATQLADALSATPPALSSPAPDVAEGWRSMDSAPKDGTDILLYAPAGEWEGKPTEARTTVGHWTTEEECRRQVGDCGGECRCPEYDHDDPYWLSWDGGFLAELPPTHWMPLPPAPGAVSATPPAGEGSEALEETAKRIAGVFYRSAFPETDLSDDELWAAKEEDDRALYVSAALAARQEG